MNQHACYSRRGQAQRTLTTAQARGGAEQRDALVTSWHRYSEFRALHASVAEELGLPTDFPVAKARLLSVHLGLLVEHTLLKLTSADACPDANRESS